MAFAARNAANQSENDVTMVKDVKAASLKASSSLLQQGSKRRAPLGDVSNLTANVLARATAAKDAGPVKPAAKPAAAPARSVSSKETAAEAAARASGPRTRSQAKGLSMSSVLQTRSEAATSTRKAAAPPSPLPDIDVGDRANPLSVCDYVNDIHSYYRRIEPRYRVDPTYMKSQTDINEKMRAILIDWLEEVHLKFKLMPETLFLTVNLIDRFLEQKQVTRRNLQLVGVTAMLIASKYEEIWAPEVRDFVYISDKAYTREQILDCEKLVLNTLKFNLTLPTCYNFLARFLKAACMHLDRQVSLLCSYLVELALVDASMLKYSYSIQSAAAVYVAMKATGKADAYPKALSRHSGFSLEAVLPCAQALVELMRKAPTNTLGAVHKKYSATKFGEVAKVAVPEGITESA